MSNQWLRLWHEMPTDPKWRTIARISGQPISLVQAAYVHLLVDASRNVTRGHATVTQEDLASALDVTEEAIEAILDAMQGRVLDGMKLLGWEKRQPKREDSGGENSGAKSAAQRKREQREREKAAIGLTSEHGDVTQCHAESRNVTLDTDTDKSSLEANASLSASRPNQIPPCPVDEIIDAYETNLPTLPTVRRSLFMAGKNVEALRQRWKWVMTSVHERGARAGQRLANTSEEGVQWFSRFFQYVSESDFLIGKAGQWKADLAWLVTASKFELVLSGKYHTEEVAA